MINLFCIRPKGLNVGNEAIFIAMQYFVYRAFGQVVNLISIPATSHHESQARAGLTAKTIHEINQYGHGVVIGGGNLYENGELEVDLNALHALNVPMILFSLSRGRIYGRNSCLVDRTDSMPVHVIQELHQKASFSLARDKATDAYLKAIGCNSQLGGCPTVFLDRMTDRLPKLSPSDQDNVLISVRNPALMNIPLPKQSQVYNDIERIIHFLQSDGISNIRLLCHDYRDIAFAASFAGMRYIYTGDVYTYLSLLRSCSLNISYRLHATLPCVAFGTPTIKISYDERSLSLVDTIGLGEWNINMVEAKDVFEEIVERYRNLATFENLRQKAVSEWQRLESVMGETFRAFAEEVKLFAET